MHKRDLKDIIHISTEYRTNHCLVCCKLRLHFKTKPREGASKKKFNLNKLQSALVKADFQAGLQSKLENSDFPEDTSETLWDQLESAIREVDNRLAKANNTFGRLYKRVWNSKHLKKGPKTSIYDSLSSPIGSLRTILNIHWNNRHQRWGPWSGRNNQHRGHVAEKPCPVELDIFRMVRWGDSSLWWTLHWPLW